MECGGRVEECMSASRPPSELVNPTFQRLRLSSLASLKFVVLIRPGRLSPVVIGLSITSPDLTGIKAPQLSRFLLAA